MFHKKLNINGEDYPIAVNISGRGAPTTSTEGAVDMFYRNLDDDSVYQCIAVSGDVYTWKLFVSSDADSSSADAIPDYWQTALEEGTQAINEKLCTAGVNKSAFLFYSDVHWNYGSQMSPTLLKYLYRHTGITKTFFGGDIVNDEATDYDTMEYLWDWRNQLKDLPNHHSVVGNHDDGNSTNNLFNEQYVYGYLLAAEETPDITRGENGIYYYIDNGSEKTRYLFLDTAYKGVGDEQKEFVKQALINTPNGWHIVVISHIWYLPDYNQYSVRPIPIAGLDSGASQLIDMFDVYNSRSGDYTECSGKVEFCIGGHVHRDYVDKTAGGIPIILVETDSQHIRSAFSYTKGTTTESSVNGVIADYNTNTLYVVRVGRGDSFTVDLSNAETSVTYAVYNNLTNVESSSDISYVIKGEAYSTTLTATSGAIKTVTVTMGGTDITSTAYNSGTGEVYISAVTGAVVITATAGESETDEPDTPAYTNLFVKSEAVDDYRLNSSGALVSASGDLVTGFISVKPNTSYTIRAYNKSKPEYSSIGRLSEYSTKDESSHVVQYRVSEHEDHYFEGTTCVFPFTTSSTTNFIRLNIISGGGGDLIITLNEPIE